MGRGLLIIVSGLFVVYGIIQNSLNQRQTEITSYSANYATQTKAETIANTMADLAFSEVNENPSDTAAGRFSERELLGGKGSVDLRRERPFASQGNPFVVHKILTARGTYQGETVEIVVKTRRREFSRYSYFTVDEPTIYFQDGDVLNGPVHTNGVIHIDGDPVFNGEVTSPNPPDERPGSDPVYNGGKDFNAQSINLPNEGATNDLGSTAGNGGLRFNKPIRVDFHNDNSSGTDVGKASISTGTPSTTCVRYCWSSYYAQYKTTYTWDSPVDYNLENYNGIISSSDNVEVKGTLNGDYTLHSEKDIEIKGDLRYFDDPRDNYANGESASDDFLGIVSEGQTIVDENAHKENGSKDIDIHASIMALAEHESFTVEDFDDGENRGKLNLLGGLIQYERGPVALLSGSGYLKNYTYDDRFLGRAPRGFPPSDIYDFVSWKTNYK